MQNIVPTQKPPYSRLKSRACGGIFVNSYGEVAPTGIRKTDMLLFALLIAAGAVLAISYRKKRSRNTR